MLPVDTKGETSTKTADDTEPPPPYTEGSSPLQSFTYIMAAAGGPATLITQVQQGGPPINTLGGNESTCGLLLCMVGREMLIHTAILDVSGDETINLDLR